MEEVVVASVGMEGLGTLISMVALAINILVVLVGGAWKLGRVELALREAIAHSEQEVEARIDRNSREFGEVASALRAKITEVELYTRDNFIRRDAFLATYSETRTDLKQVEKTVAELVRAVTALAAKNGN